MPISGLVATLSESADAALLAIATLAGLPGVELQPPVGRRLPLTLDTASPAADRAAWQRIQDVPGVLSLDVVFIHFEEDDET